MDRLPQEIIDQIAAWLPEGKLEVTEPSTPANSDAPGEKVGLVKKLFFKTLRRTHPQVSAPAVAPARYWTRASAASISRRWQHAIEALIYSNLVLGYHGLEKLKSALERIPERRSYLRSLTVVLTLTLQHWTNIGIRKDALQPIFSALGGAEDSVASVTVDLTLRFEAGDADLRHSTREGIVFDRLHSVPVGAAACVRTLDFTPATPDTEKGRRDVLRLHLTEQADLVAHFPNLQGVAWHYAEDVLQAVRDASRDGFAARLVEHLAARRRQIATVSLTLSVGLLGRNMSSPQSVGADSYLNLYAKLRAATAHVADFSYSGIVGPSLLQGPKRKGGGAEEEQEGGGAGGEDEGSWQSLRNLTICMALLTPEGKFYFESDAFGEIELDTSLSWRRPALRQAAAAARHGGGGMPEATPVSFLERPDEDTMGPLLGAFAGLVARLPVLETALLVARRGADRHTPWAVCYCAPGRTSAWLGGSEMDMEKPRVWFVTGAWRPGDALVQQFRRAGRGAGHAGNVSIIHWSIVDPPVCM
ncbi:hypothetical protein IF1G_01437 [Cordyceps javanica]|uniref:Uncharacterized protein n=1 Tax=Cordyceps javanica TaxID=43265 RepID=A0A545VBU7_9HYPO|nr:hypothetical protein IF1G_01437 [Cordyceps javanica]TQW11101.1 hypothetical protein IF2G_02043 [Cordyceps javanica]